MFTPGSRSLLIPNEAVMKSLTKLNIITTASADYQGKHALSV
jgi:hypothetical protein